MYLSQKILERAIQPSQDGSSGLVLDLSLKQLIGLKGIEKFLEPNEIEKLLLSTNYMAVLDQNFHLFNNLRELDVSINHISKIENLESLQNLKLLNLSNNRISKIENLEVLKNLEVLDLSMNYIERIEGLKIKGLKTLILSGNNISELENLQHVKQLQNLEIEKNRIEHINNLTIFGLRDLRKIVFAYNRISIEYFDDLLKVLEVMPTLEEINFIGNEVTLHKLYKPKIVQFNNIKVLDKLALKDPIKKHFEALRQDNDIKELVEETKKEYLDRMEKETQLKAATLEMLEKQKQQVDQLFDEHMKILQTDMHCFFERAQELKQRRMEGLGEEITQKVLDEWKVGVKKSAVEKKEAYEEALKRQQQLQREYLESELTSKKFTDKLYEIAMKRPEIWKEIKLKEQEQFIAEEDEVNKARRMNPHDESELRHYQTLANQIQINMIKDVANAVIDYEAKELHDQREKAATVLKHALLKQMVNHYTNLKQNNRPAEEDEEEEEVSQRDKERMKFETTEDQLKQMLYSKVYKDGKWKNKDKEGPQDYSNQSLQELLGMEGNRKSPPSNRKTKKKATTLKGTNPMIHEVDEDRHYSPYQRDSPPPQIPNYDDDDLERDPFEANGATYYDEKHVVGEKSGQKIILIPFEENTNMLDGISAIKDPKKKEKLPSPPPKANKASPQKPIEKPIEKPASKKKKKDDLQNVLANLDEYDDNGNKAPTLNIPEYQLQNKPYGVLDQVPEKKKPKKIPLEEEQVPQDQEEQEETNRPKKKKTRQEPEEMGPEANEPPKKESKANKNKGKEKENPEPPKKSSACNIF